MKNKYLKSFMLLLALTLLLTNFTAVPVTADSVPVIAAPNLGSASTFGLLGVSISNTNPTFVSGDVGSDGQTSAPTLTSGANFLNDAKYHAANHDLGLAIDDANSRACTVNGQAGADIGGQVLTPGVYCFPGAVNVTGTLTLSGNGIFIIKADGAFNTTANAVVALMNGAQAGNVFYVINGASTLGANTNLSGTIMSRAAITVDTSNIVGRILSQPAVTISTSTITVPVVTLQQNLVVSSICTDNPVNTRKWIVHNPNSTTVNFSYVLEGTSQLGAKAITGNSDLEITTNTQGTNKLNLLVNGVVQTFMTSTGTTCVTATATATPTPTPTPTATPIATQTPGPSATATPVPSATTPAPVATATPIPTAAPTPGPCLKDSSTTAAVVSVPTGAKLISNSAGFSVWSISNGNLIIHAKLPSAAKGNGTWNFNLGGKAYSVSGTEDITYTVIKPPVGTYKTTAEFVSNCGPANVFESATITVPTVTGGQLPNTATPWYNMLLIGTLLMLVGAFVWRRRKLHE
ncbi:MAG: hypothetical protein JWM44_1962 [Bacilli bacterium]|nr:hypothetical protein [Bacilli bacterium]